MLLGPRTTVELLQNKSLRIVRLGLDIGMLFICQIVVSFFGLSILHSCCIGKKQTNKLKILFLLEKLNIIKSTIYYHPVLTNIS